MSFPNPGYPAPRNVVLVTRGGVRLNVRAEFAEVKMDRGVPTPVWTLVLDGQNTLATIDVDHVEGDVPPGCILQFPQRGDAVDNAQKIEERSRKAAATSRRLGLTRLIDPTNTRIEPQ